MTYKAFLISIGIKNLYKNFKLYNGYLKETGWNHSVKQTSSVDKFGEAIPWFKYPCFRFLNTRLKKDLKIFEFGSGNSTLWFSKNSQKVFSVEHDKDWFEKLKIVLRNIGNVDYVHRTLTNGDYKNEILKYEKFFDIIIIDGRDRVNCVFNSIGTWKRFLLWRKKDLGALIFGVLVL